MARKIRTCLHRHCNEEGSVFGYCREHYEENEGKSRKRDNAISSLHSCTIDGNLPDDLKVREEFLRLCRWWSDACLSLQTKQSVGHIPVDEAEYAMEWCIGLTQLIIEYQEMPPLERKESYNLEYTRNWVWERFRNLEAGLHSNGTLRK